MDDLAETVVIASTMRGKRSAKLYPLRVARPWRPSGQGCEIRRQSGPVGGSLAGRGRHGWMGAGKLTWGHGPFSQCRLAAGVLVWELLTQP